MQTDNAALVRSLYEAFNAREFDRSVVLFADESEIANMATGATFRGGEGYRAFVDGWTGAFPDAQTYVHNIVDAGDHVAVEFSGRGTHNGPLQTPDGPIPPTGRKVDVQFCDVWHVRDGRVLSGRTYFDLSTMMAQLGLAAAER